MKRMIWRALVMFSVLILLMGSGYAQTTFSWDGTFPSLPTLEHHSYRASAAKVDVDALAEKLWPGGAWKTEPFGDDGALYTLDAASNTRGKFREVIEVWEGTVSYYWDFSDTTPKLKDIGGYDTALAGTEAFLKSWLPDEMFAHLLPSYGSFDEDGNSTDRFYELRWAQEVEPGVRAHTIKSAECLRANYYSYGVSLAVLNWLEFTPADEGMKVPAYLSAEEALASLNYAADHLAPVYETSILKRASRIVAIDPGFSDVFDPEESLSLCWAFSLQDVDKGSVQTVFVDAATGAVYDHISGQLDGQPR